jgi:MarR family transcriptional regulator, organic hydroperoxide resistance regulator
MSAATDRQRGDGGTQAAPRQATEDLRKALIHMGAAERRLRSRDQTRPGELTFAQLRTIAVLGREQQMTVGELAKHADLKPASVTVMLDQLEAAGIVERHRSTEDRRVCNVSLTPEGWQLMEHKLGNWQRLWEERLAGMSDEDLRTAMTVIGQVTELYDSVAASFEETAGEAH